tara:strand:- start:66422 stop:66811 length:390 start_codon:yes stop_codon:yes gene_type:complete
MIVKVNVSLGELVDKITILEIKTERIDDAEKVKLAASEKETLELSLKALGDDVVTEIGTLREELKAINEKLWVIEDEIRVKEHEKDFGEDFVDLARRVYVTNDMRFGVKNKINNKFDSQYKEVKSYKEY